MKGVAARLRSLVRPRRGQAIIETALVMPNLVPLVFDIAEVSLYLYDYIQASNRAREVARLATPRDPDATSVSYLVSAKLKPTLNPDKYEELPVGSPVEATVKADHSWIALDNLVPGLPETVNACVTMRMEAR